jgi:hypothetical protein
MSLLTSESNYSPDRSEDLASTTVMLVPGLFGITGYPLDKKTADNTNHLPPHEVTDVSKDPEWWSFSNNSHDQIAKFQFEFPALASLIATISEHVTPFVLARALWLYAQAKESKTNIVIAHSGGTVYALVLAVLFIGDKGAPMIHLHAPLGLNNPNSQLSTRAAELICNFVREVGKWNTTPSEESHSLLRAAKEKIERFGRYFFVILREISANIQFLAYPLVELLASSYSSSGLQRKIYFHFLGRDLLAPLTESIEQKLTEKEIPFSSNPESAHAINWQQVVKKALLGNSAYSEERPSEAAPLASAPTTDTPAFS